MKNLKVHVYFFLIVLVVTNGCLCGNGKNNDDDGLYTFYCENIESVSKSFTLEIHGKYRANNEPIQNEGKVLVQVKIHDYIFKSVDLEFEQLCLYDLATTKKNYESNFDYSGKAVILIDEFEFDNKHDLFYFDISVDVQGTSDDKFFWNSKIASAKYNSPEKSILFFSYITEGDL